MPGHYDLMAFDDACRIQWPVYEAPWKKAPENRNIKYTGPVVGGAGSAKETWLEVGLFIRTTSSPINDTVTYY